VEIVVCCFMVRLACCRPRILLRFFSTVSNFQYRFIKGTEIIPSTADGGKLQLPDRSTTTDASADKSPRAVDAADRVRVLQRIPQRYLQIVL
jgi:hypothetical protein